MSVENIPKERLDELNGDLNDQQRIAAETLDGPMMIVAGAGSGKTKTLIHRVATMIESGIPPTSIMVVTFTNKAADEIKERLKMMIGDHADYIVAGTFHSVILNQIIRKFPDSKILDSLGIDGSSVDVIDGDMSKEIMRDCMSALPQEFIDQIEDNEWTENTFLTAISYQRALGLDLNGFISTVDQGGPDEIFHTTMANLWSDYNQRCRDMNCIDFDDILIVANKMVSSEPSIVKGLSVSYRYMMLDEYQDTNRVQAEVMNTIAFEQENSNICMVGDEKQSIYGFRGADINNTLNAETVFPSIKKMHLNQNYRSYPLIVGAANACAFNMSEKITDGQLVGMRKIEEADDLLTKRKQNDCSFVYFDSDKKESELIVNSIKRDLKEGVEPSGIAVLYRNRYLKKEIEKNLVKNKIDYKIVGDRSFFTKKEVRDAIALAKFSFDPSNTIHGLRVIDRTPIKIAKKTADEEMKQKGMTLYQYLINRSEERLNVTKKGDSEPDYTKLAKTLRPFIKLVSLVQEGYEYGDKPSDVMGMLSKIWDIYLKDSVEKDVRNSDDPARDLTEKIDNVSHVFGRIQSDLEEGFTARESLDNLSFLSEPEKHTEVDSSNQVNLMTIHASKGLEFDNVYVIAANQMVMPGNDVEDMRQVEEERRGFYVALTRASKKATVSSANRLSVFGREVETQPSMYMEEIAKRANVNEIKISDDGTVSKLSSKKTNDFSRSNNSYEMR